jgi:hypothetical protein
MPIEIVNLEQKQYTIAGAEFKLKPPTLGVKRRGAGMASVILVKVYELIAISEKYGEDTDASNLAVYKELGLTAERANEASEELFTKAEELFKIILEPVKAGDESKLIADNFDGGLVGQVLSDFFQIAGVSIMPANN